MGVHSMVSHAISKMKRDDTTNARTLASWGRRVLGIAQDLDKSNDNDKQQRLITTVTNVAQQLAGAEESPPTGNTGLFAPRVYLKRKEILCGADRALDLIQIPAEGHPEEMQKAISKDENALGTMLKELSQADDTLLEEVSVLQPTKKRDATPHNHKADVVQQANQASTKGASPVSALPREEKAHEQFKKILLEHKRGSRDPSIIVAISDMGSENAEAISHLIPLSHTFGALVESLTNSDPEMFLPDIWAKASDPNRNCITESGVWWEWQDPSKKVIDAINKEGHMGIETVCKEVEYVVVLVKKGKTENGVPIEIPRKCRQPALLHLQQHFPNHVVSQVRCLRQGSPLNEVLFDNRTFYHKTNPLFVELKSHPTKIPMEGMVVEVEAAPKIDKGKGKAIDGY